MATRRKQRQAKSKSSGSQRTLAVTSLIAAFLMVVVMVSSSLSGDSSENDISPAKGSKRSKSTVVTKTQKIKKSVYVVKTGDILSVISEKTGVPVDRILELNPDVDPQTLTPGQRLKLSP